MLGFTAWKASKPGLSGGMVVSGETEGRFSSFFIRIPPFWLLYESYGG